jgi:uncharacterized repeat protein (TIGR01451 family)
MNAFVSREARWRQLEIFVTQESRRTPAAQSSMEWRHSMTSRASRFALLLVLAAAFIVSTPPAPAQVVSSAISETGHDTSPTLQSLAGGVSNPQLCPKLSQQLGTGLSIDQNFCGYITSPTVIPPDNKSPLASDTSGAVGPNHYFQTVNYVATIFDKSGNVVLGPFSTTAFWSGFGYISDRCAGGFSDVVVMYDHSADRWFLSKFASLPQSDGTTSWYQCFAVSTTADPTGQYYRYVFLIDPVDWNDYPKFGIWPDGYYMTANNRGDSSNPLPPVGHFVVAFERSKMLAGQAAREIIFKIDNGGLRAGILPADWDGKMMPPAGSPNYLARSLDPNMGWPFSAVEVWTVQVDWAGANGVLTLQEFLLADPFNSKLCSSQNCIPQPGTAQGLDPLAFGQPMFRLAYRNVGDHEALAFTQTVDAGDFPNHSGIHWYELRKSLGGPWSIYQQSTFAPDSDHRWMGSIAMDREGNMAMGYNVSSSSVYPGIRIAGRLAGDTPGAMTEEAILQAGIGSETGFVFFADYSQTTVDPLDDCTFWYTGTYQPLSTTNERSWATKIGSFRFPSCAADLAVTKTRSPSGVIDAGTNVTYKITLTNNGPADAGNVTLNDAVPAGTVLALFSSPSDWACERPLYGGSGPITCTKTIVAAGESVEFTVVVTAKCSTPNGTVITNTASASEATPVDNDSSNDSQQVSFTMNNPVPVVTASLAVKLLPQNNHDLVNVGLAASVTDGPYCPAPAAIVHVYGDENDETPTAPNEVFSPDAKDITIESLRVRQERVNGGDGRVYLVVVSATDQAGGTGFAANTVGVPKSSSEGNIASVLAQAAAAKAFADANSGMPPAGYFVIGDGPVVGPKQ